MGLSLPETRAVRGWLFHTDVSIRLTCWMFEQRILRPEIQTLERARLPPSIVPAVALPISWPLNNQPLTSDCSPEPGELCCPSWAEPSAWLTDACGSQLGHRTSARPHRTSRQSPPSSAKGSPLLCTHTCFASRGQDLPLSLLHPRPRCSSSVTAFQLGSKFVAHTRSVDQCLIISGLDN